MSLSCYVYYRVRIDRANEAEGLARAVMHDIGAKWPIKAHLARKIDEPALWMEVYQGIDGDPATFVADLDTVVAARGLQQLMPEGERRHVEVFECV